MSIKKFVTVHDQRGGRGSCRDIRRKTCCFGKKWFRQEPQPPSNTRRFWQATIYRERLQKFYIIGCLFLSSFGLSGCDNSKTNGGKNSSQPSASAETGSTASKTPVSPSNLEPTGLDPTIDLMGRNSNSDRSVIRFATLNASMSREASGDLIRELANGEAQQPSLVAEVIQRVRPDVLLLNEFDFDEAGEGLRLFQTNYLQQSQNNQSPIEYSYIFLAPSNTGIDSGHDLNRDGKLGTVDDAFGFGQHPGQYGMVVLSKYPFNQENTRTFQQFLWKDMPNALWPIDPETNQPYYSSEIREIFRLSSKSHWDIPIKMGQSTIHFLVSHPTPPVFDGPEDRNGCRNHDEIRFWADYISAADYIYDDQGRRGGLPVGAMFVIAGDLNADPNDGDSRNEAIGLLTHHPLVRSTPIPNSAGGVFFSKEQRGANQNHRGDPAYDTADFNDQVGNLRVDYCLPSKNLELIEAKVFWPLPDDPTSHLNAASDHHMVWIDVVW